MARTGVIERDEAADAEAQAISRIEGATGATSDGVATHTEKKPEPIRMKRPKLPVLPGNLDAPVAVYDARLTLLSFGKPAMNVSASLAFEIRSPKFDVGLMGEHAFTMGFMGGLLGMGIQILGHEDTVDQKDNSVKQKIAVRVPRFIDEQTDQILMCLAPLLQQNGKKLIEDLVTDGERPWRLNFPSTNIEGELRIYQMQQSFDLTTRAEDNEGGETLEPLEGE